MNQNNMHMIPQPVIDCAENLFNTKQEHLKQSYIVRLETIRDYCNQVLQSAQHQGNFIPPKKNNILKSKKSQLNYSRIGRNNV